MENSKIEWTDDSFNPWYGCQKVSPGCDHCYAEHDADHRYHLVQWGPHGVRRRASPATWKKPFHFAKMARASGRRRRVFCASWADVFDNQVPREWRVDLFELIRATPELDWLLLTKRPENIRRMLPVDWIDGWPNVWLGITAEDQTHFDRRWPILPPFHPRIVQRWETATSVATLRSRWWLIMWINSMCSFYASRRAGRGDIADYRSRD